ncbi:MAG TPA: hypothetical protein VFM93_14150 [Candidatus Limnocylindria bacterium]|nr:hypothetical protein [Candidatus Limnocylindria bacterium]
MTAKAATLRRRPTPPPTVAARYRGYARDARKRRVRPRPLALTAAAWVLMIAIGAVVLVRTGDAVGGSLGSIAGDIGDAIGQAFPSLAGTISEQQSVATVSAAPVIDQLPSFTTQSTTMLQGHVPTFALGEARKVEIALNGKVIAVTAPDPQGRFAQQLTLVDGNNEVSIALLDGSTVVATTASSVVVDKTPPPLSLVRPAAGAVLTGTTVVVEGKSEADARITVNERVVAATPDGTFSESFTAQAGTQTITVIARDRAGNETKETLTVTVREAPVTATGGIALSLDRTRVRPGAPVVADITVLEGGRPKPDVIVTLFVGVVDLGAAKTNSGGTAKIGFAAPTTEGEIAVVVLGNGGSARATLTVAR